MNQFSRNSAVSLITCFLIAVSGSQYPAYLHDGVSVSCGSGGTHMARESMEWIGDADSRFKSLLQVKGSSTTSRGRGGADSIPYTTARISRSRFSYMFRLQPGQKLVRLHFYPIPYLKNFQDLFTVEAGNFILLSQFSASATADALGVKYLVKEFCLYVEEKQKLEIVFSSERSRSMNAYAFINGIEIASVPLHLSYFVGGIKLVGHNSPVYVDNSTALEVVHRLHIKLDSAGDNLRKDVFGMWGAGEHRAGKEIKNMTWNVSVDVGFSYLVRLHFCDIGIKMAEIRSINFTVFINGLIAASKDDVLQERGGYYGIPWYEDRIVMIKGLKQQGLKDISVSLLLHSAFMNESGLLKGFEIFKLSNTDNNLAGANSKPQTRHQPSQGCHSLMLVLGGRNTTAAVTITLLILANIVIHYLRNTWEANPAEEQRTPNPAQEQRKPSSWTARCRRFSLAEIRAATKNFSSELILGRGGFGIVYQGLIDNGNEMVAIKTLKYDSWQGEREFWTEIKTLSELRHVNLVSLIGYCCEKPNLILVYEYMAGGTLGDRLYKPDMNSNSHLSWQQRLRICIGASRGLDYLHTGYGIIHRDVKASNILLDENIMAKIADFGLAKLYNTKDQLQSHVITNVKGTREYLDPYYENTHKLTQKSDTYSFGVVLLEVLCGRPALDKRAEDDKRRITKWAKEIMSKGEVDEMVDLSIREEITPESLKVFMQIVEGCLDEETKKRPTMAQVVLQLASALEQQERPSSLVPQVAVDVHWSNNVKARLAINSGTFTTSSSQDVESQLKEQTIMKAISAKQKTGPRHEKKTDRMYRPVQIRPWNSVWNRVTAFKKKNTSDGYLNSELRHQKLGMMLYSDLVAATRNFSVEKKISEGKFGSVYKGMLHGGREIAIKRRERDSWMKFTKSQLDLVWQIPHHKNLCWLVGFCQEGDVSLLVYEYMANHSLSDNLHGSGNVKKNDSAINSWRTRIKISQGIAEGIDYLHRTMVPRIIHGNIKSSKILLDEDLTPRVGDLEFSLLNMGNDILMNMRLDDGNRFVDPECVAMGPLTEKCDVYSLGVVLLELLTGKKAVFHGYGGEIMNIVRYAVPEIEDGNLQDILDPRVGVPDVNQGRALEMMADTAVLCTRAKGEERPSMRETVRQLADAMVATANCLHC